MQIHKSPFTLTETEKSRVGLFEEYFWWNSEVCANCFQRVREVGERHTIQLEEPAEKLLAEGGGIPVELEIADHYERTEYGSQEFTPWDLPSDRFGTCFCLDCGTDCTASNDPVSVETLLNRITKIVRYTDEQTPIDIDEDEFKQRVRDLKTGENAREHQGWDLEILAISWARSVTNNE